MKIPRSLAAGCMLAAALAAPWASAADISKPVEALTLTDGSAFFGALFTGNNSGNTFSDRYTFSTSGLANLSADLTSHSGVPSNGLDITGFALYSSGGGLVQAGNQLSTGTVDQWSLNSANLAPGSYYLLVSGSMESQSAGKYYASASVQPVPEPENIAMLLGGLGLLVAASRRRPGA